MCHRAHRADTDPLRDVGLKDITAHVDFSGIALAAQDAGLDVIGYTSQARFLINCGLPWRARYRPVVSWTVHCPVCGADCTRDIYPDRPGDGCGHRESFVVDVPVAEVLAAVDDLTRAGVAA